MSAYSRPKRDETRLFPSWNAQTVGIEPDAPSRLAASILGSKSVLSSPQRLGRNLSPVQEIQRLLWLYFEAVRAETRGRVRLANFYWSEFDQQWRKVPADYPGWQAACETAPTGEKNATAFRAKIVLECFLDGHMALHNGWDARGERDRAACHLEKARALIPHCGFTREEVEDIEAQSRWPGVRELAARKDWDGILRLIGQPKSATEAAGWLPFVHRQALEQARSQGDRPLAITHARWLRTAFPAEPAYRAYEICALAELYSEARRKSDPAAARFAEALADAEPGNTALSRWNCDVQRISLELMIASGRVEEALPVAIAAAMANRDSVQALDRVPSLIVSIALGKIRPADAESRESDARDDAELCRSTLTASRDFSKTSPNAGAPIPLWGCCIPTVTSTPVWGRVMQILDDIEQDVPEESHDHQPPALLRSVS